MVSKVLATRGLKGIGVMNDKGQSLGRIRELALDLDTGRVAYAVLAYGGFPNRTKLFAVPWELLTYSPHDRRFILNVPREVLANGPGYDELQRVMDSTDFYWLGDTFQYFSNNPDWAMKSEGERQLDLARAQQKRGEVAAAQKAKAQAQ